MRSAVARATVFAMTVATLAAAGCANVLNIEDFTVLDGGDGSALGQLSPEGGDSDATTGPDATTASDASDAGEVGDGSNAADASGGGDGATALDGGDAGGSSPCIAGGACTPAVCQVGQLVCNDGGLFCSAAQSATNGTPCGDAGAGSVCDQGACTPCNTGGDCSTPNSCKKSVYVCSTGTAVCTDAGNASDGTGCGSGMSCYGGVCSACTVGAACTPATACHLGKVSSCAGGVATCMDTGQTAGNGASCGNNQVCNGGSCVTCAANVSCTPANACHSGLTSCASGTSVCSDTGSLSNGTPCTGTDKCNQTYTCQAGVCTGSNPVACSGGMVCVTGTCQCTGSTTNCSGTCADLTGTDANNCGRCGHGCAGGGCTGGKCQPVTVVSSTVNGGYAIDFATDGTNVVWANSNDNTIDVVTSLGGAKTVLATNANGGVSSPVNVALAPSSGDVYWVQQGGELGHTTLGGASPGIISSQTGNVGGLIAADSSASFLISTGGYITLFSCTNSGTCFTQTSTTCSCSADVQSDTMGFEFWGDITDQQVVFMNVVTTGNPPVDYLVTGQPNAYYFTGDGTYAYWGAGTSTYYIARAPINAPTTAQTVLSNSGGSIVGITTDNTNLYYADGSQIYYVNIASAVAAAGAITPTALTSFASGTTVYPKYASGAVYFFNSSAIMRIATP